MYVQSCALAIRGFGPVGRLCAYQPKAPDPQLFVQSSGPLDQIPIQGRLGQSSAPSGAKACGVGPLGPLDPRDRAAQAGLLPKKQQNGLLRLCERRALYKGRPGITVPRGPGTPGGLLFEVHPAEVLCEQNAPQLVIRQHWGVRQSTPMLELCDHELPCRKAPEKGPPDEGVFIDNPIVAVQKGRRRSTRRERVQKGDDRGELHLSEEEEKCRKRKERERKGKGSKTG
jgi:hypothetical protein